MTRPADKLMAEVLLDAPASEADIREVFEFVEGDCALTIGRDLAAAPAIAPLPVVDDADALIALIDDTVGMDRLRCLHLNDSKVDFGANKDRHENIGDGTIGADGLAAVLEKAVCKGGHRVTLSFCKTRHRLECSITFGPAGDG